VRSSGAKRPKCQGCTAPVSASGSRPVLRSHVRVPCPAGDYDLAGFAVGAVERSRLLPRADIAPGDVLLGLPSSGLHSNGFSLVRAVLARTGLSYASPAPWAPAQTLGDALLAPTRIYVRALLPILRQGRVKALAHVTGGGFVENVPRALPTGLGAAIDVGAWALPGVFRWLMHAGGVDALEMCKTFNCGMGMVLVVAEEDVEGVLGTLEEQGAAGVRIGGVTSEPGVEMRGLETWGT
jgi:phosphoribosylamine--glycine ligase / phosphoribosylformylglycinamidine cyclo-ligase